MADNDKTVPSRSKSGSSLSETTREWDPFAGLHRDIDQLFNALRGGLWQSASGRGMADLLPARQRLTGQSVAPAVDITEKDGQYELTAELPGLDPEQVEVKFAHGRLTIKGEKKEERQEEREGYHLSERSYGAFHRSFTVPDGVDAEKIAADFKNGVLTITMPKTPELQEKERRIAIKAQ